MIYNFNLGIGWASSGVEYAQSYRCNVLRGLDIPAKFIFTDMFPTENIEHMTRNIGFLDTEVLWAYAMATDVKMAPVSYTIEQLLHTLGDRSYEWKREGKTGKILFGGNNFYTVYFTNETEELVHRVEIVSEGCLIRKDYFTYCRIYSEYYAPLDHKAHMYERRFFNEDGSLAYEEIIDGDVVTYRMEDDILYSKEEFIGYLVRKLPLTDKDIILLDRTTGIGQSVMENAGPARLGVVIHADHFSEGSSTEEHILWNNFYEYSFSQHERVDFYITATEAQKKLLEEQFAKTYGITPMVYAIPVGSLDMLRGKDSIRNKHALITASRLATEKHIDWSIRAVARVHESFPEVTFDIYGKGQEAERLEALIKELHAEDYIRLMGQHKLDEVYKNYEVYVSASMSEGFGLTLLEAVGSGLPIIGFDVRYGNQTFIRDGENGYLIPVQEKMSELEKVDCLYDRIVRMLKNADMNTVRDASYEIAEGYLTSEVEAKWARLIQDMTR